jgi:hypothetical protein
MHFRFSFEPRSPRFSEVYKSLFLAPPLRATSCNRYTIVDRYDNERETWIKQVYSWLGLIYKFRSFVTLVLNFSGFKCNPRIYNSKILQTSKYVYYFRILLIPGKSIFEYNA